MDIKIDNKKDKTKINPIIKKDIISVLNDVIDILRVKESKDVFELKALSNHTIHNASIFQDKDSITVAIVIYSLYKILDRNKDINVFDDLVSARDFLIKDNVVGFRGVIRNILKKISETDKRLERFIQDVIEKAKVRKGMKIHEHGISMAKVSELLGISLWELMSYVGKTRMFDIENINIDVNKRLSFVREVFK